MVTTNALNITATGIVKYDGVGTFTATTTTNHAVLIGAPSNAITNVGPIAATGAVLQSNGLGSDPGFSTATYPSIAGTSGKILISDGTNIVSSTPTFPNASATGGKQIRSDGTNWVAGTIIWGNSLTTNNLLYASTTNTQGQITSANNGTLVTSNTGVPSILAGPGTTGNILQSNAAAAPSFSTATYPSSTTSQQILYSSATNTVSELTTANSKFPATNSSGTLAMRALSVVVQTFLAGGSTTYTPTAGMLYCTIECLGGGAGGGGVSGGATTITSGGGGGAGSYARKTASAATIGASQTVTVGAAANGGTAGANNGTAGNDTSVGAICVGKGGSAGLGASTGAGGAGGLGGVAGTGDFTPTGAPGFSSYFSAATGVISLGGAGGSSQWGGGGRAPQASISSAAGNAATNYGSGGSGAASHASATTAAGGNGSAGIVVITEYVIA